MIEQPKVVKAIYIKRLQELLARREADSSPEAAYSGLCRYLSNCPDTSAEERAAIQLGLLLVHYRTRGNLRAAVWDLGIDIRTMHGILQDYHRCSLPLLRRARLLAMVWAQVLADMRAIPATELTALIRAYRSACRSGYGLVHSLAEIFAHKPDAVALKRLSLPASGQTTFTKRIMKIVGEK